MQTIGTPLMWALFVFFVFIALVVDFFALSRQGAHRVSMRKAGVWSLVTTASVLAASIVLSLYIPARGRPAGASLNSAGTNH